MRERIPCRLLIADDDRELVQLLTFRCKAIGIEVIEAYNANTAKLMIRACQPDIICLDVNMPGENSLSICEELRSDPVFSSISIIILTGDSSAETEMRSDGVNANFVKKGASAWTQIKDILDKNMQVVDTFDHQISQSMVSNITESQGKQQDQVQNVLPSWKLQAASNAIPEIADPEIQKNEEVMDAVFAALGLEENGLEFFEGVDKQEAKPVAETFASESSAPWVLHIDDDTEMCDLVKMRLGLYGIQVENAFDGTSGFRHACLNPASAILLDFHMPNGQGDYVLRRLKENHLTRNIPVFILTGLVDRFLENQLLRMGAESIFRKPPEFDEIVRLLGRYVKTTKPMFVH